MTHGPHLGAHLLLICHGGADLAARAEARVRAASGYVTATHLGPADLGHSHDLPARTFRAMVPSAILRHLADLPPDHVLLVEIHEDPDALRQPQPPTPPDRLIAAAMAQPQGFFHGQALCWPQDHHVAFPAFARLGTDAAQAGGLPFLWPSPSIYGAGPDCVAFLQDWDSAAADPGVAGDVTDPQGQGSDLLREHEGAWAAGSVLAHLHGAAALSLVWAPPEAAPALPQPEAEGDDPPAPADPVPPTELIAPLTLGGLTLDQAEAWLARPDGPVRIGKAAAQVLDALLLAQLDQIAVSGRGRICRDHLMALLRQDAQDDLMLAVLTASRQRALLSVWPALASRVNLAWIEQVIEGQAHDLHDLRVITHAQLTALLEDQDRLSRSLAASVVWHLIQSDGRTRFRRRHGAFAASAGQKVMDRFVSDLPEAERARLTRPIPMAQADDRLSASLRARLEAWMAAE